MYMAYSPFYCQLVSLRTLQLHPWPFWSLSLLPGEYSALKTRLTEGA